MSITNNNTVILFWVLVFAVLLLSTPTKCPSLDPKKEGFYSYSGYYKKYCPSCGWRSRYSCDKCTNCGYCITASGYGECVPGDSSGPYFRSDCKFWSYNDEYFSYPFSHVFPIVKIRSQYPYYRWRRNHPWRQDKK